MKKAFCVLFGLLCLAFPLSGCSNRAADDSSGYVAPAENCIVSVPNAFLLGAPVNSQTACEKIETAIKDIEKRNGRDYYSVTKNAPLQMVRDESWVDYDGYDRFGSGKAVSGFRVGERNIPFNLSDAKFTFSCDENCDIEPIYEKFTTVGGIFVEKAESAELDIDFLYDARNFFYDGKIKQEEGFYYLYLKDNFGDMPDCWNTNFKVKSFSCTERDGSIVNASFTVEKFADDFAACIVCRYGANENYFVRSVILSGSEVGGVMVGITMDVGENELNIQFTE